VPYGPEAEGLAAHQVVVQLRVADEALSAENTPPSLLNPCSATMMKDLLDMSPLASDTAAVAAGLLTVL